MFEPQKEKFNTREVPLLTMLSTEMLAVDSICIFTHRLVFLPPVRVFTHQKAWRGCIEDWIN